MAAVAAAEATLTSNLAIMPVCRSSDYWCYTNDATRPVAIG